MCVCVCVCVCVLMVDAQFTKQLGDQFQMLAPSRVKCNVGLERVYTLLLKTEGRFDLSSYQGLSVQ